MANTTFQLRRSSVAGKQPNTSTLSTGELALNLTDQKLYSSNGSVVFEPASNVTSLYVGNSTVSGTLYTDASNNFVVNTSSNNSIIFNIGATTRLRISNNGNIGIGTFPTYKLDVSGTGYFSSDLIANTYSTKTAYNSTTGGFIANTTTIGIGNSSVKATVNSTVYTGTSNNASYLGGTAASDYQTTSGLSANVATLTSNNASYLGGTAAANFVANTSGGLTQNSSGHFIVSNTGVVVNSTGVFVNSNYIATISANAATYLNGKTESNLNVNNALTSNNSTYLNGQLASYYTNASNITTGTLPYAQLPANVINTTSNFTITGVHTHNANIVMSSTSGISANGSYGSSGQYLTSNGSTVYWSTSSGAPTIVRQNFTGDGTTTSFAVTGGYTADNIDVYLNGVKQRNGTDVTVSSGNNVVFSVAPANGALIDAVGSIATVPVAGVNTDSQYTWTNTHTFRSTILFGNTTVQTTVNNTLISVGNTTVNTQIIAGNVYLNGSTLVIGNSTVNSVTNSSVTTTSFGNNTSRVYRKTFILNGYTSNSAETELFINSAERIPFSNNTTIYYNIDIVGRSNNSSDSAAFNIKGVSESRSNSISTATLTSNGSGYLAVPNVTITDASGTTANITATVLNGKVNSLIIKNNGINYSSPTITISSPQLTPINFNANSDVTNSSILTTANSTIANTTAKFSTYFAVNDPIVYYTATGNTVLQGLSNNTTYYVQFVNATSIALSNTVGGSRIPLQKGLNQTGHYLKGATATATATTSSMSFVDIGNLVETIVARTDINWYADVRANNSTQTVNIYVKGATNKNVTWTGIVNTMEVYS